ncbi:MAG: hypothetical protein ACLS4Y_03080 [Faecalibacterium sp.]
MSKNAMLLQAVGASQKLTAQAAGGKNTAMTWLSSNPDVATGEHRRHGNRGGRW